MSLRRFFQLTAGRHVSLFVGFAVTVAVSACGSPDSSVQDADDAGRPRDHSLEAQRIVSLTPPVTELLFDLGVGDRLVGRTRFDTYPPAALAVPDVGDAFPPNLEAVFSRDPDLVVAYHTESNAQMLARLDAAGIASLSIRLDLFESVPRSLRWLGAVTGREAVADSLARQFEIDLARFEPAKDGPAGLLLVWDNPPMVIGSASFLHELLTYAGAHNVFGDVDQPSFTVTIETVAAADPDFVVFNGETVPAFVTRPEWQTVRAVRERRFVLIHGTEFSWPSLRAPQAVELLRAAIDSVMKSFGQ